MLRLAFDFIITWRETRTRPNAYRQTIPQHYAERKNTSADTEKTKCFIYIPDKTIFLFPSRVLLNII